MTAPLVPSTGDDGEMESYAAIVRNRKKKCRGNVGSEKIVATLACWSSWQRCLGLLQPSPYSSAEPLNAPALCRGANIFKEIHQVVAHWPKYADEVGLSADWRDKIARTHRLEGLL